MIYENDLNEILPRLKGPLRAILDAELASGNEMVEVSTRWPMPVVNIWLKNPLTDDPRNWLEEYVDKENGAMLAAKC